MRRILTFAILLGTIGAGGCLTKPKRRAPLATHQPLPPLPSALEKAQPPSAPQPAASLSANTLPDTGEYRSVPIPAAPQALVEAPVTIPVSAILPEPNAADEERKRLLERLREKREREKEAEKEKPMLPSAIAPKEPVAPPKLEPKAEIKPSSGNDLAAARRLFKILAAKYESMTDYEAHMTRREVVGGREMPTEEVLFQFRKKPFSIYMMNVGEVGKGREVLYVDGKFDGLMHVVSGQGDVAKFLVGFKTSLKPDSSMATSKSRHKITDAGPPQHIVKIDRYLKLAEAGKTTVKHLGTLTRKDQPSAVEGLEIAVPPGEDPLLPKGGKWALYFEPRTEQPNHGNLLVHQLFDETGREVEYYCFTKFRVPANLTDADFHPDRLGGKKK
jgi:Protein of unknown function (DUF1571)